MIDPLSIFKMQAMENFIRQALQEIIFLLRGRLPFGGGSESTPVTVMFRIVSEIAVSAGPCRKEAIR